MHQSRPAVFLCSLSPYALLCIPLKQLGFKKKNPSVCLTQWYQLLNLLWGCFHYSVTSLFIALSLLQTANQIPWEALSGVQRAKKQKLPVCPVGRKLFYFTAADGSWDMTGICDKLRMYFSLSFWISLEDTHWEHCYHIVYTFTWGKFHSWTFPMWGCTLKDFSIQVAFYKTIKSGLYWTDERNWAIISAAVTIAVLLQPFSAALQMCLVLNFLVLTSVIIRCRLALGKV